MLDTILADMVPFAKDMIVMLRGVFSDALTTTFLTGAIIMAVAVVVSLFIRAIPLVSAKDYEPKTQEQQKAN